MRKTHRILQGNAVEVLKALPTESIHCCVTSPPYWGLRSYGTPPQVWSGDPNCGHDWVSHVPSQTNGEPAGADFCSKCSAWRGELGLEPSPELYVQHVVEIFREVHRVLRGDGTLFLILGDSYWGGKGRSGYELPHEAEQRRINGRTLQSGHNVPGYRELRPQDGKHPILKPKDLIGIPWRVAFGLRADGWCLRSDIVWNKPNPMPESVTDRPTKAHEYVFLMAKSKKYFYDAEAVKEPNSEGAVQRFGLNPEISVVNRKAAGMDGENRAAAAVRMPEWLPSGRNRRSVWTVSTQSSRVTHFATFPEKLAEPCIKAGTSEHGCCPVCGTQWTRVIKKNLIPTKKAARNFVIDRRDHKGKEANDQGSKRQRDGHKSGWIRADKTIGWKSNCNCEAVPPISCTVLDPFSGSGTTGLVALKLGRRYLGVELKPEYVRMGKRRIGTKVESQEGRLAA